MLTMQLSKPGCSHDTGRLLTYQQPWHRTFTDLSAASYYSIYWELLSLHWF